MAEAVGGTNLQNYFTNIAVQEKMAAIAEAQFELQKWEAEQIAKPNADFSRQIDQAKFNLAQRESEHAMALADKEFGLDQQRFGLDQQKVGNQSQQYDVDLAQRQFEQNQAGLSRSGMFDPNATAQLPYHYQNDQLTRDYRSLYGRDPTWEEKQALMPWYSRAVQPNAVTTPTAPQGESDEQKEANVRKLIEADLGRSLTQPEWDTWKTGRVAPGAPQVNPGSNTKIGDVLQDTTFDQYRGLMPATSQQQWQQNTGRVVPTAAQNEEKRQEAWVKQQVEKDVGRPITAAEWETWKTGRVAAGSPQINEGSQTKEGDVLGELPTDKWRAYMPDRYKTAYQQNTGRAVAAPDPAVTAEAPWGHAPTGSGATAAAAAQGTGTGVTAASGGTRYGVQSGGQATGVGDMLPPPGTQANQAGGGNVAQTGKQPWQEAMSNATMQGYANRLQSGQGRALGQGQETSEERAYMGQAPNQTGGAPGAVPQIWAGGTGQGATGATYGAQSGGGQARYGAQSGGGQQPGIGGMLPQPGAPTQGAQPGGGYTAGGGPNPYSGQARTVYNPLTGKTYNVELPQQAQDLAEWQARQRSGIETGELTGYYNGQQTAAERRAGENLQFQQAQMAANPANAAAMAAYRGQAPWQQAMTQAVDNRYGMQGQGGGQQPNWQMAGTGGRIPSAGGDNPYDALNASPEMQAINSAYANVNSQIQQMRASGASEDQLRAFQQSERQRLAPMEAAARQREEQARPSIQTWEQGRQARQTPGTAPGGYMPGTGGTYQGSYVPGGREMNTAQYQQMTPSERTAFGSYVTASQGKSLGDWEQEHKRWQPQQQRSAAGGGWR